MIRKILTVVITAIAAVTLTVGCSANRHAIVRPPQEAVDEYLAANPELPATDRKAINEGRMVIGIMTSTLIFLMGEPNTKTTVVQPWATQELWNYRRRGTFVIEDNYVVGIDEETGRR